MSKWTRGTIDDRAKDPFAPEVVEETIAASLRQDAPVSPATTLIRGLADASTLPPAADAVLARSRATLARRAAALGRGTLATAEEPEISFDSEPAASRSSAWSPPPQHRPVSSFAAARRALAAVLVVALLGASFFALFHGIPRPSAHPMATPSPALTPIPTATPTLLPANPLTWQPVTTAAPPGPMVFAADGESAYACVVGNDSQGNGALSIWHTSDRGVDWIPARVVPQDPTIDGCEMVVDASDPSVAALAWQPRGGGAGDSYTGGMTTNDGGVTWQATPTEPFTEIDQLDSRGGVIYALRETTDSSDGVNFGLWASSDRMRSWHQMDHGLPLYLSGFWLQPDGGGILTVESNAPNAPSSLWYSPDNGATWRQVAVSGGLPSSYWTARGNPFGMPQNPLVARSLHGTFRICVYNGAVVDSPQHVQSPAVSCSTDGGATWHLYALPSITSSEEGMSLLAIANDGSLLVSDSGTLYRVNTPSGGAEYILPALESLGPLPTPDIVYCPTPGPGMLWAAPVGGSHRLFTAGYTQ